MKLTSFSPYFFSQPVFLHAWQGDDWGTGGDEGIHSLNCPIARYETAATHYAPKMRKTLPAVANTVSKVDRVATMRDAKGKPTDT